MKAKIVIGARIILGLIFFVLGGLNGILQFLEMPAPPPEAGAFLQALQQSGYLFPLLKALELVAGAMLLANAYVPLALILLAPIIVNIVGYHVVLDPSGMPMTIVILALEIFLAYAYWPHLKRVLSFRASIGQVTANQDPSSASEVQP